MELVIKLDDETYKEVMERTEFDTLSLGVKLIEAVQNGIQLPKGHGRLIDADKILDSHQFMYNTFDTYNDYNRAYDAIDLADTIIEADKGE